MLSQVAKLFLFRNWFAIIDLWLVHLLETSRQLLGLESVLVLLFFLSFFCLWVSQNPTKLQAF